MDWKKSNYSKSELEAQQKLYIKEALEMAKRSLAQAASAKPAPDPDKHEKKPSPEENAEIHGDIITEKIAEKAITAKEEPIADEKSEKQASEETEYVVLEEKTEQNTTEEKTELPFTEEQEELTRYIPEEECIDVKEELAPLFAEKKEKNCDPPNFNQYITNHNKNQCACQACRAKRMIK